MSPISPRTSRPELFMPGVHADLVRQAIRLANAPATVDSTGPRPSRRIVFALTGTAALAVVIVAVVLAIRPSPAPEPLIVRAEAVAASPVDAQTVLRRLGRADLVPIPPADPLIRKARQTLEHTGVDTTRGVAVPIAAGATAWLLGGDGTVCLLQPGRGAGIAITNCAEAGDALQHGFGGSTYDTDPTDPEGIETIFLIVPPNTRTPYVTAKGSPTPVRTAKLSANGAFATVDVRPGEELVNPAAPGGQQRPSDRP